MSKIWKSDVDLKVLNGFSTDTCPGHLGIEFLEYGDDFLVASMPVNARTVQPMRILHGGASVVLAETVGSVASAMCVGEGKTAVGVSINANHLRPVPEGGVVTATCTPIRLGRTLHVWDIKIRDQKDRMTCISRLTMAVVDI